MPEADADGIPDATAAVTSLAYRVTYSLVKNETTSGGSLRSSVIEMLSSEGMLSFEKIVLKYHHKASLAKLRCTLPFPREG